MSAKIEDKSITIEDITDLETVTYRWSRQISEFNYETNHQIFTQICNSGNFDQYVEKILYLVSVIELLGSKYINIAISLHENNFMIHENDFFETINKYTQWDNANAWSYTIILRKSTKIITHKYKVLNLHIS